MYEYRWYFRVKADAGLAHDENGDNASAYLQVKMGFEHEVSSDDRAKIHQELKTAVAKQFGIDPDLVEPISEEEYDSETEPDGEVSDSE